MARRFTVAARIQSFRYAFRGLWLMLTSQHNAWLHLVATIAAVVAGLVLGLDRTEWCWILVACLAVWTAEALNTAFEFLCDVAAPEFHPLARNAKDVAAGAVLLAALGSLVIAAIILGPHVWQALRAG